MVIPVVLPTCHKTTSSLKPTSITNPHSHACRLRPPPHQLQAPITSTALPALFTGPKGPLPQAPLTSGVLHQLQGPLTSHLRHPPTHLGTPTALPGGRTRHKALYLWRPPSTARSPHLSITIPTQPPTWELPQPCQQALVRSPHQQQPALAIKPTCPHRRRRRRCRRRCRCRCRRCRPEMLRQDRQERQPDGVHPGALQQSRHVQRLALKPSRPCGAGRNTGGRGPRLGGCGGRGAPLEGGGDGRLRG